MKIKCPKCGTENDSHAKFCNECGYQLSAEGEAIENSSPEAAEEKTAEERNTSRYRNWGKKDISVPKKKRSKKKIAIGAVIVVILIGLLSMCSSPKIVDISASYGEGNDEAGVVLDEKNTNITVIGTDEKGETHELSGWTIEEPQTLEKDESATVTVQYKDLTDDLTVNCSSSAVESLTVEYDGDTEENVVLDENNPGFTVYANYKNGDTEQIDSGWTVASPVTLEADGDADVTVRYEGVDSTVHIVCSTVTVTKISAKYDGKTKKGTWLNENNDGIHVTATYASGEKQEVSDWTIKKNAKLKAGHTAQVKISYAGKTCTLKVRCTSKTKAQKEAAYKAKCQSISYDSLARNPDTYKYNNYKFTGKVAQVMEEDGVVDMRINVTNEGYGYWDDTIYVVYQYEKGQSKFLEDDIVAVYGISMGLYSYESVMGATITIPMLYASYVDIN